MATDKDDNLRGVLDGIVYRETAVMGWVNDAIAELAAGRTVQVRAFGGSMRGRIESGEQVTLAPVSPRGFVDSQAVDGDSSPCYHGVVSDFDRTGSSPIVGLFRGQRTSALWLGLITVVLAASCSPAKAALKEASQGTCQRACHEEHDDSLYDENRCLETCEPPP